MGAAARQIAAAVLTGSDEVETPPHSHVERIKSANSQWWERSKYLLKLRGP